MGAAAALNGCGATSASGSENEQGLFVMQPSLPDLPGAIGAIRGVVVYAEGFDRYPEYARVARCVFTRGGIVGQLQYSANPPEPGAVSLVFRDRTSGTLFRSAPSSAAEARLERAEDTLSGRVTFVVKMAAAGFAPSAESLRAVRPSDCKVTVHQ